MPYKLRIGVSGHRDLPDASAVALAVKSLLDRLQATLESEWRHPHAYAAASTPLRERIDHLLTRCAKTFWRAIPISSHHTTDDRRTPIEWTVISSLAKGADRIVAQAVLDRPGARLQAILPFAAADYRRDFIELDDLQEFNDLLSRDDAPTVLPNDYAPAEPGDSESVKNLKQSRRNAGYMAAGRRVADACEILIVIWNGEPAKGLGGTGDVVDYALHRSRAVIWIDSNAPANPPKWLEAEKSKRGADSTCPYIEKPLPGNAKTLSMNFHQVAAYNRGAAFDAAGWEARYRWQENHLRTCAKTARLDEAFLAPAIQHLLPHYAKAAQMAARYQKLHTFGAVGIHCLSAAAVSVAVTQLLFFPHAHWIILLEVAAMLLAVVLLRLNRNEAWHEKWLHDRHLAERLRTACFTSLIERTTLAPPPEMEESLPFYRGHGSWVSQCCDHLIRQCERAVTPVRDLPPLKRFLIDAWISHQAEYHATTSEKKERGVFRSRTVGAILFVTTFVMALIHVFVHQEPGDGWTLAGIALALVVLLSITLPAWGAASQAINSLLERERIVSRSNQMAEVLSEITQEAEAAATIKELLAIVNKAHRVMATENQEWMVSLSFKVPDLPA